MANPKLKPCSIRNNATATIRVLPAIAFILAFAGCSTIQRKLYAPTLINNPSLQAKNDYCFTAEISNPKGVDVQGGYALTNKLAFIAGLYSYYNTDKQEDYSLFSTSSSTSDLVYQHKGFHVGSGVYFPLSSKNLNTIFAAFAGYTNGSFAMRETLYDNSNGQSTSPKLNFYKSDITRWFVQAGITQHNKRTELSGIVRFNFVGYNKVNTDYSPSEQWSYTLPPTAYPKWSQFLDISFDTKVFFSDKKIFGLQFTATTGARWKREVYNFYYYASRIGIGLVFKSPFRG